jgi:hypothetical protein
VPLRIGPMSTCMPLGQRHRRSSDIQTPSSTLHKQVWSWNLGVRRPKGTQWLDGTKRHDSNWTASWTMFLAYCPIHGLLRFAYREDVALKSFGHIVTSSVAQRSLPLARTTASTGHPGADQYAYSVNDYVKTLIAMRRPRCAKEPAASHESSSLGHGKRPRGAVQASHTAWCSGRTQAEARYAEVLHTSE